MDDDWSSRTNWTVSSGSLLNSLSFQSSLSDDTNANADADKLLHPLILHPPSPDSPCDITLKFKQKHEVRQIYVRSTARVYEIYYASNLHSDNDYLCTVRCGIAVRDGEILQIHESDSLPSQDQNNNTINEDSDWVQVKLPHTKTYHSPNSTQTQDLFEATAEIDDATPCISVTLRLLSLQTKDCVYVDEIYMFGDPVDSADSENIESRNENSSASSLMAMFLPTIMQLSKTTGLSRLNDVTKEKKHVSRDGLEEIHPSDSVIETQSEGKASTTGPQEVRLKEVNGDWVSPSQPDTLSQFAKAESDHTDVPSQAPKMESNHNVVPSQVAAMETNHRAVPSQISETECNHCAVPSQVATTGSNHGNSSCGNAERVFERLISRMDRLEEICLGFQEKMVMPMSNIEARLQRVEQQLDTLTKKLQDSGSSSCYRISAPDASCLETDAYSPDNCFGHTVTRVIESNVKDLHIQVPVVSPDDIPDSANITQLLPGLVVKAPDFPEGEDEEDDASGQEINSSNDKGKLSIDEALSSALANFLSSASPRYTKSLTVKAPDFSNEDDDDYEIESTNEIEKNDSLHVTDSEKINHIQVLTPSDISLQSGEKVNRGSNDKHSEETAQDAEEDAQFCSVEGDQAEECVKASTVAEHNPITGLSNNFEEDENVKINGEKCDDLSSNGSDISNELLDNQTASGSGITQEGLSTRTDLTVETEIPKKPSHEDIIENVLGFSLASSLVNFETSLLDVKFISQTSPVNEPFLESLLVDTPETSSRDPYSSSVKESSDDHPFKEQLKNNDDLSVEEGQLNLVSIDDQELVNHASDSHFAMDTDYCALISVPVNNSGDSSPDDHKRKRDQVYTVSSSSLI
ncbi:hypothetical protein RIF29_32760 [Crotalaria pallida]|uniref:Uncharacterized protein n=1 Tax=Crotalaria pallida TaxID=3830 RepID=A0AAN9HZJ5_CROPI